MRRVTLSFLLEREEEKARRVRRSARYPRRILLNIREVREGDLRAMKVNLG